VGIDESKVQQLWEQLQAVLDELIWSFADENSNFFWDFVVMVKLISDDSK
jgi:hypothetical protein